MCSPPILSKCTHKQLLGCFLVQQSGNFVGRKILLTLLANHQLTGSIDQLAGLHIPGAAFNAGKAAETFVKRLGIHQSLNIAVLYVRNELMGLDIHLVVRGAGSGAFAALHALERIHTADFFYEFYLIAHSASSFIPKASARSSVK
jgi:hypothetical protein